MKRSSRASDQVHVRWRAQLQREVEKLHHTLQELDQGGMVERGFENPGEANEKREEKK